MADKRTKHEVPGRTYGLSLSSGNAMLQLPVVLTTDDPMDLADWFDGLQDKWNTELRRRQQRQESE